MKDNDNDQKGRLELTWTNKSKQLLATDEGSYQWIDPSDYRVAEVRLLKELQTISATASSRRASANLLICGDALHGLTSLAKIPEYAKEYANKVQLIYIDPPFNTKQNFSRYLDNLEHSVWLTMIRDRLKQMQSLLAPTGSIWVHLNQDEVHYCKVMMDEIFAREAFVAEVVWQKRTSRENRAAIGSAHDTILVYAPVGSIAWKKYRNRLPDTGSYANPDNDPRGPWRSIPMTAQGTRRNQMYTIYTPDGRSVDPPKGRCWSMVEREYERLLQQGNIYFPRKGPGRRPRVKAFPQDSTGFVPMTWWPAEECGTTETAKKEILTMFPDVEAFDTPKPEKLLQRIIHIATKPGDVVLDCFAGSGTTAAVAQKMGRRWVAIERSKSNVETFIVPRLTQALAHNVNGQSKVKHPIKLLRVASSIFEEKNNTLILSDRVTLGDLAESVAAQCGIPYDPSPPFAGRDGATKLAVIDGVITGDVCRILLDSSTESDIIIVYGSSVEPISKLLLASHRPGSQAKQIPQDLLNSTGSGDPRAVVQSLTRCRPA